MPYTLTDSTRLWVDGSEMTWGEFRQFADRDYDIEEAAEWLREDGRFEGIQHGDWEPTDDQIMNGPGVEGGIAYPALSRLRRHADGRNPIHAGAVA